MMNAEDEITYLNYSLRRLQKLVNPPKAVVYRLGILLAFFVLVYRLIAYPWYSFGWFPPCVLILLLKSIVVETVEFVFERDSSRCLVVTPDAIGFGKKTPEYWRSRRNLEVKKGICGTHLITNPRGLAVVVSKNAISFSELKELVEMHAEPEAGV